MGCNSANSIALKEIHFPHSDLVTYYAPRTLCVTHFLAAATETAQRALGPLYRWLDHWSLPPNSEKVEPSFYGEFPTRLALNQPLPA